jgi:hypothetical protein
LEIKEYLIEILSEAEEDFSIIMRYMMETYQDYKEETFRDIIRRVRPEEETKMMSQFAQQILSDSPPEWVRREWEQRMRQEGRQEGRQEEGASILLLQLEEKFDTLSDQIKGKILTADQSTLEKWSISFVKAKTLDDVFGV